MADYKSDDATYPLKVCEKVTITKNDMGREEGMGGYAGYGVDMQGMGWICRVWGGYEGYGVDMQGMGVREEGMGGYAGYGVDMQGMGGREEGMGGYAGYGGREE